MARQPRKEYFLITEREEKSLVLAENGIEATNIWFEERKKEREAEGITVSFSPKFFTVEKLGRGVYEKTE